MQRNEVFHNGLKRFWRTTFDERLCFLEGDNVGLFSNIETLSCVVIKAGYAQKPSLTVHCRGELGGSECLIFLLEFFHGQVFTITFIVFIEHPFITEIVGRSSVMQEICNVLKPVNGYLC